MVGCTVERLLALPDWSSAAQVAGGRAGLQRVVAAVRPVSSVDAAYTARNGDVIVVAEPVPVDDWRLDVMLRRVADAGGAAILVTLDEPPQGATTLLADRFQLPLLITDARALDLMLSARLHLAEPELELASLLLAVQHLAADRATDPGDLVRGLRKLLQVRTGLVDDRGHLVAGELDQPAGIRTEQPVPQRTALPDGVLLAHPVFVGTSRRPALWLAAEVSGVAVARADIIMTTLGFASGLVQRWLLGHQLELERDARLRTALLGDVLRLDGEPPAELRRRVVEAGWRLGGWHVGIRVDAVAGLDVVGHRQDVAQAFASERLDATVVEQEAGWTAWVTFPHEPAAPEIRDVGTGLRKAQARLRPDVSSRMGVGRPHAGVAGLATTVSEAADAARLAAMRPEAGHFLHVDQLGVAQLLLEWTRTDTFQPAARSLLAPLLGQSGDLVTTLTAYLDAESSVAETAAVLGVHRNTVAARIRRIEELLDVDLNHRDDRLALHLACRTLTLSADPTT